MVYSKSLIEGEEAIETGVGVSVGGVEIATAWGYPAATSAGIQAAIDISGGAVTAGAGGGGLVFTYTGTTCTVTYVASTNDGVAPTITLAPDGSPGC